MSRGRFSSLRGVARSGALPSKMSKTDYSAVGTAQVGHSRPLECGPLPLTRATPDATGLRVAIGSLVVADERSSQR